MRTLPASSRSLITPATSLSRLIRWRTARSDWSRLGEGVGARQWPGLARPRWMSWLVYGLPILGAAAAVVALPPLADRALLKSETVGLIVSVASELRAFVATACLILTWVLLVRLSKPFSRALPRNIQRVGDLIPFVMTSRKMSWTREQIEQGVREIAVGPSQLAKERILADTP